jgi:hypothetical protein
MLPPETAKKKTRTLLFTPLTTPFIVMCAIVAREVTQEGKVVGGSKKHGRELLHHDVVSGGNMDKA